MSSRTLVPIMTIALACYFGCKSADTESEQQGENKTNVEEVEMPETTQPNMPVRPLANVAASDRMEYYKNEPAMVIDSQKKYGATIHTNKGDIVLELDPFYAPLHTNNFVFLSQQGFYDGLTFHRVVPDFVVQGGDPLGAGSGGPGYLVPAEIGLQHEQGVVAMARRPDQVNPEKKSSGSQFYITLKPTPFLDGEYSVFGKVVKGFEVVQSIAIGDQINRIDIEEK